MTAPAVYSDATAEFRAATETAAIHENSQIGRLNATGADGLDLINRLSTNKVIDLEPGQGAPTILTTDRGRILDLIAVINLGDYTLLLTSPGQQQTVIEWLAKYTIMEDLEVTDITGETAFLTVCGPTSETALAEAVGVNLAQLQPYHAQTANVAGHEATIIRRPVGRLPSFDLLLSPEAQPAVWDHLTAAGITPLGAEAFEAARVSLAVPQLGSEMGDAFNPLEAGLIGSIDFAKGCYIGQEVIARLDTYQKVQKRLAFLTFPDDAPVCAGDALQQEGKDVGRVTSVSRNPTDGQLVGLGYVRTAAANVGQRLELPGSPETWAEIQDLPQLFGPGQDQ